jgi:hypothetical protein
LLTSTILRECSARQSDEGKSNDRFHQHDTPLLFLTSR